MEWSREKKVPSLPVVSLELRGSELQKRTTMAFFKNFSTFLSSNSGKCVWGRGRNFRKNWINSENVRNAVVFSELATLAAGIRWKARLCGNSNLEQRSINPP